MPPAVPRKPVVIYPPSRGVPLVAAVQLCVNRHGRRSARTSGKIVPQRLETAMTTLVEELSARAKTLSVQDRARLAEELLASLDQEPDSEVDAAWDREIQRRVAEVESGTVALVSSEDVHAEARRLIRR
jgi:putative addiction module component (TIGR02574 family)